MAPRVHFSFHEADAGRAARLRERLGVAWPEGAQLSDGDCTVVLIGAKTAGQPWIDYAIIKSWAERKGVLGIRIHRIADEEGRTSRQGPNPFDHIGMARGNKLSGMATVYDPPPGDVEAYIAEHFDAWVEEAIFKREVFGD